MDLQLTQMWNLQIQVLKDWDRFQQVQSFGCCGLVRSIVYNLYNLLCNTDLHQIETVTSELHLEWWWRSALANFQAWCLTEYLVSLSMLCSYLYNERQTSVCKKYPFNTWFRAGFVEEMRFVAMKLHTKDQAPKEGGKEASKHPMQKVQFGKFSCDCHRADLRFSAPKTMISYTSSSLPYCIIEPLQCWKSYQLYS